jgi:hypothetical protein
MAIFPAFFVGGFFFFNAQNENFCKLAKSLNMYFALPKPGYNTSFNIFGRMVKKPSYSTVSLRVGLFTYIHFLTNVFGE